MDITIMLIANIYVNYWAENKEELQLVEVKESIFKKIINKLLVLVKFILNFRIEYFLNKKLDIEDLIYTID